MNSFPCPLVLALSLGCCALSCQSTKSLIYGPEGVQPAFSQENSAQKNKLAPDLIESAPAPAPVADTVPMTTAPKAAKGKSRPARNRPLVAAAPEPIQAATLVKPNSAEVPLQQAATAPKKRGFFKRRVAPVPVLVSTDTAPATAAMTSARKPQAAAPRANPAAPVLVPRKNSVIAAGSPNQEQLSAPQKPSFFKKVFGKKQAAPPVATVAEPVIAPRPTAPKASSATPKARKETVAKASPPKRNQERAAESRPKPRKKVQEEPSENTSSSTGSGESGSTTSTPAPPPSVSVEPMELNPSSSQDSAPLSEPVSLPKKPEPVPAVVKPKAAEPKADVPSLPKPELRLE